MNDHPEFIPLLPVHSPFSKAVYKEIRPGIPHQFWPADAVVATFTPAASGLYLDAQFLNLPRPQALLAAQLVAQAGFVLVRESPAALLAAASFRLQRLRNIALFAIVPLLFAIPLMNALSPMAMRLAAGVFVIDALALLAFQTQLLRCRARLATGRFRAEIPAPGMRIRV